MAKSPSHDIGEEELAAISGLTPMSFAFRAHRGQKRKYIGSPYTDHLAEVAGPPRACGVQPGFCRRPGTPARPAAARRAPRPYRAASDAHRLTPSAAASAASAETPGALSGNARMRTVSRSAFVHTLIQG